MANHYLLRYSTFAIGASEMTAISDLLERVAKATEGSRRLDAWVDVVIANPTEWNWQIRENPDRILDPSTYTEKAFPRYTVSIDAALALVERKLPGAMISLVQLPARWQASVLEVDPDNPDAVAEDWTEDADTAPLAILAALLRALESETPA